MAHLHHMDDLFVVPRQTLGWEHDEQLGFTFYQGAVSHTHGTRQPPFQHGAILDIVQESTVDEWASCQSIYE